MSAVGFAPVTSEDPELDQLREACKRLNFTIRAVKDAQELFDKKGLVNALYALGCNCTAGRLGVNAPAPLAKGALEQTLNWDGKDDLGKRAEGGPFSVRIALGLKPELDRFLGDNPAALGSVRALGEVRTGGGEVEDVLRVVADALDVLDDAHVGEDGRRLDRAVHADVHDQGPADLALGLVDALVGLAQVGSDHVGVRAADEGRRGHVEAVAVVREHLKEQALDLLAELGSPPSSEAATELKEAILKTASDLSKQMISVEKAREVELPLPPVYEKVAPLLEDLEGEGTRPKLIRALLSHAAELREIKTALDRLETFVKHNGLGQYRRSQELVEQALQAGLIEDSNWGKTFREAQEPGRSIVVQVHATW